MRGLFSGKDINYQYFRSYNLEYIERKNHMYFYYECLVKYLKT